MRDESFLFPPSSLNACLISADKIVNEREQTGRRGRRGRAGGHGRPGGPTAESERTRNVWNDLKSEYQTTRERAADREYERGGNDDRPAALRPLGLVLGLVAVTTGLAIAAGLAVTARLLIRVRRPLFFRWRLGPRGACGCLHICSARPAEPLPVGHRATTIGAGNQCRLLWEFSIFVRTCVQWARSVPAGRDAPGRGAGCA